MVKKISFLILSLAILVIGVTAFGKLGYWDRSVRIFGFSPNTSFEGRGGRGFEGRGEFTRPDRRQLPDSIRARFEAREGRPVRGSGNGNIHDSIRHQFGPGNGDRIGRGPSEGGIRNGEGRGRGEFARGKKVNLGNVLRFLAVFASFTVLAIYLDKTFRLIRKRKPE
jgi:hypothetical protein